MHLLARAHIPDAGHGVTATGDQDVERRVQGHGVDGREVTMVLAHHLVVLQVPALDLFILAG